MMFSIILVVMLVGTVTAQSTLEGRRTLCGRELAKAHYMYCYGLAVLDGSMDLDNKATGKEIGPKIPGRFTYKLRRSIDSAQFENSLIDSCCLKPCHINELLNHC